MNVAASMSWKLFDSNNVLGAALWIFLRVIVSRIMSFASVFVYSHIMFATMPRGVSRFSARQLYHVGPTNGDGQSDLLSLNVNGVMDNNGVNLGPRCHGCSLVAHEYCILTYILGLGF